VYEVNRELGQQISYLNEIARKKDIPVLIKGGGSGPEIVGATEIGLNYLDKFYGANYWKLDRSLEKKAKKSLVARLGKI